MIIGLFLIFFWLPIDNSRFAGAVIESLALVKWYAQTRPLMSGACLFHCRWYCLLCVASGGNEISGACCEKGSCLWRSLGLRYHSGGLLVHYPALVRRHISKGSGFGAGHRLPLFWTRHQCPGHSSRQQQGYLELPLALLGR